MSAIEILNASDSSHAVELLHAAFYDDRGVEFVFPSSNSRRRWLPTAFAATIRMILDYGAVTGIRTRENFDLAAVAMWFLPDRPFPPPWHRMLIPALRLMPMVFEFPTFMRDYRLSEFYLSLVPHDRRCFYLAGLAVQLDYRNKGLGRRMIQWGIDQATAEGCDVFLHCWSALVPYYQRLGFTPITEGRLEGIDDTCHGLIWQAEGRAEQLDLNEG